MLIASYHIVWLNRSCVCCSIGCRERTSLYLTIKSSLSHFVESLCQRRHCWMLRQQKRRTAKAKNYLGTACNCLLKTFSEPVVFAPWLWRGLLMLCNTDSNRSQFLWLPLWNNAVEERRGSEGCGYAICSHYNLMQCVCVCVRECRCSCFSVCRVLSHRFIHRRYQYGKLYSCIL